MTNLDEALMIAEKILPGFAYVTLQKAIYPDSTTLPEELGPMTRITKSLAPKRIVYGVVIDPYGKDGNQPDAHGDWTPPDTVEEMAHRFLVKSRKINFQHMAKTDAELVESWVEHYPTPDDYQNARNKQPHKVLRRRFGDDVLHSGSWVIGVKLTSELWNLFEQGEIKAFSPGGMVLRKQIESSAMPKVEFVDLISSA